MTDIFYQTASWLAESIHEGKISATEVSEVFLSRIASENPSLNTIVTLDETRVRQRARDADEAMARGEIWGPLHGVPVTFKDVFETAGLRTTAGHKPLSEYIPETNATVVSRLQNAGAIVLGKTNMPELAMDTQCENSLFGVTSNPWHPERTPGGSTGGEAAAIAAGMTPLGLGSDIGGSIRIPAHYCGVFGLKPTEGRVPQSGHIPPLPGSPNWIRHLAASGPLARSVADLRMCLKIIAGPDGHDLAVSPVTLADVPVRPLKKYRFAWTDQFGDLAVSADTSVAMRKLADDLTDAGCRVEHTAPRNFSFDEIWRTYGELIGIMLAAHAPLPSRVIAKTLGPLMFRNDVITQAAAGKTTANIRSYFDILQRRDKLIRSLENFLANYDGWLCPVASSPAPLFRKKGKINNPIDVDGKMVPGHLGAIGYTCPFNLTGNPVLVVPLAVSGDGLPIGVQVVGPLWGEMALLNVAEAMTQITGPFHRPAKY